MKNQKWRMRDIILLPSKEDSTKSCQMNTHSMRNTVNPPFGFQIINLYTAQEGRTVGSYVSFILMSTRFHPGIVAGVMSIVSGQTISSFLCLKGLSGQKLSKDNSWLTCDTIFSVTFRTAVLILDRFPKSTDELLWRGNRIVDPTLLVRKDKTENPISNPAFWFSV